MGGGVTKPWQEWRARAVSGQRSVCPAVARCCRSPAPALSQCLNPGENIMRRGRKWGDQEDTMESRNKKQETSLWLTINLENCVLHNIAPWWTLERAWPQAGQGCPSVTASRGSKCWAEPLPISLTLPSRQYRENSLVTDYGENRVRRSWALVHDQRSSLASLSAALVGRSLGGQQEETRTAQNGPE